MQINCHVNKLNSISPIWTFNIQPFVALHLSNWSWKLLTALRRGASQWSTAHQREGEQDGGVCALSLKKKNSVCKKDPDGINLFFFFFLHFCEAAWQLHLHLHRRPFIPQTRQLLPSKFILIRLDKVVKIQNCDCILWQSFKLWLLALLFKAASILYGHTSCCWLVLGLTLSVCGPSCCVVDLSWQRRPLVSKIVKTYTKWNQ